MKFAGICLITEDVAALTRFYEKVLQTKAEGDSLHADIRTDGAALSICARSVAEDDMGLSIQNGTGKFTMGFMVEDVDLEYERLVGLGIEIMKQPTTYPWGARSMQFVDPDGNILSLACRL